VDDDDEGWPEGMLFFLPCLSSTPTTSIAQFDDAIVQFIIATRSDITTVVGPFAAENMVIIGQNA
jgi:hypothetical protein